MSESDVTPDARKSALESDYAALYAVAGLTDALADALKSALAETQQKATRRINELQSRRPELSKQAKESAGDLRTFVITLPEQANDLLAQATSTYGDFAVRGKPAVDEVRTTARARSTKNGKPVIQRSTESERANEASEKGQLEEG